MRKEINYKEKFDVLVVGAGLSGVVIAEQLANKANLHVLVIDKRNHIAGNCYDFIDENGILMNKYGAHLFHTNDQEVWEYIQNFSKWERWDHRVLGLIDGKFVNIPVNINTVNALCGTNIKNEEEMDTWLSSVQVKYEKITNSEEVAKSRVGEILYKKIFRDYTFKQWNKYPEELDSSVLSRLPIRNNFNDRYFDDRYQVLPKTGYTEFTQAILDHPNITVRLNSDYFKIKESVDYNILIFTGPIDEYYANLGIEKLEYRSIEFIEERYKNMNFYQTNSVVNYPEPDVPFTRIVEYKHFLNQTSANTTIVKEITKKEGEPYYPVFNERNLSLYKKYEALSQKEKNVYFIGRLGNYKYFNMDQAMRNSLNFYKKLKVSYEFG
ncbi:MAG: UDP-galactopyranose mutase [Bacteroidales bacterium]|jgi:UDP-galactopyranose mutase|nr:UDP-galactopyranose mutase [Bacteroidales bacterium]